jgi:excisionase family DNA binding protein
MDTMTPMSPDSPEAKLADQAVAPIREYLNAHQDVRTVELGVDGGSERLIVPRAAVELLARVLAHMAAGRGVSLVPQHAELTTQEAADLLNVSRPFLIGLLSAGEINYRTVGKHRRIRADELMDYKRRDDQRRGRAVDELTQLDQEMGLD